MKAFTDYTNDELAALKAEWAVNLRGGKFKQAFGTLQFNTAYCCLGVFCITAGIHMDTTEEQRSYDAMKPFMEWFGLELPEVYRLNDGDKLSFPAIADYIETKRTP